MEELSKYTNSQRHYERVVFDVGCNDAFSTMNIAKAFPDTVVYGFEPSPRLIEKARERVEGLENYKLVKAAISDILVQRHFI